MIFTSPDAPFEVALSKVVGVNYYHPNTFELQLTRKQGTGVYLSPQAAYLTEVLRAVLAKHLRHVVLQQSASRSIPADVRAAVWQRDGARCAQCGSTQYIEYDHIIPFSKGGATSVANLQLLCRACNLQKGNKI